MIKLFYPDATNFDTMGLGSLSEALSCTVIEERNGDFTLELEYPVSGKLFSYIGMRSIIVTKPNPFDPPQAFRVYKVTKSLKKQLPLALNISLLICLGSLLDLLFPVLDIMRFCLL